MTPPLHGKRILNTRAAHQAEQFDALIIASGAIPIAYPCIEIVPPDNTDELDRALHDLVGGAFDWLVLTSANTVLSVSQRVEALGLRLPENQCNVAVVGTSTAEAVRDQLGLTIDLIPSDFVAESLAEAIVAAGGKRAFLPESAIARPTLAQTLTQNGMDVRAVVAYQTRCASAAPVDQFLAAHRVDVITFTSSSTVDCLMATLVTQLPDSVCVACIGPKTAQTAAEHSLRVDVIPQTYTLEGLLEAISQHFTETIGEKH